MTFRRKNIEFFTGNTGANQPLAAASRQRLTVVVIAVGVVLWGLGIVSGCLALWNHAGTPGQKSPGASAWPVGTSISRQSHRQTLILFAHPHCPCTRATLRELERVAAQTEGALDIRVEFVQPPGTSTDWARTDLWQAAASIPGVKVALDHNGLEARRFGACTSGESFLYDSAGRLMFQGGITPARGHEGDSAGKTAILRCLFGQSAETFAPVFGCPLLDSDFPPSAE